MAEQAAAEQKAKAEQALAAAQARAAELQAQFRETVARVQANIGAQEYKTAVTEAQKALTAADWTAAQRAKLEELVKTALQKSLTTDATQQGKTKVGGLIKGLGK